MLPGSGPVSLVQNYLRAQQGVIDVARPPEGAQVLLTVGERVQATVQAMLPNGRFAVLVKDQLLDMNLPSNTQPGNKLDLTVLQGSPQIRFQMDAAAPQQSPQAPNVALSQAAQRLATLVTQLASNDAAPVLRQSEPLFSGSPDPAKLASQLAGRLGESGLFYESHQAQWVSGQRSLPQLLREPQAAMVNADSTRLSGSEQAVKTQLAPSANDAQESLQGSRPEPATSQAARPADHAANDRLLFMANQGMQPDDSADPAQQLRQLVQQQLGMVEQRPLHWQGQAWPGQPMEWSLGWERDARDPQADEAETRAWQSRMDLQMPHLGSIGVIARLQNGQFSVRFVVPESASRTAVTAALPVLAQRFSAAGLQLAQALVAPDEEAGA